MALQFFDVRFGIVSGVYNRMFNIDAVGMEFTQRGFQRGNINDIASGIPEVKRQTAFTVQDKNKSCLLADLTIMIAVCS